MKRIAIVMSFRKGLLFRVGPAYGFVNHLIIPENPRGFN
jgi:hypothetical protein